MREFDRCDQIRQSALAFAVEFVGGQAQNHIWSSTGVVGAAEEFHKFLLGAPASSTKEDVEAMEGIIREDEKPSNVRTFTGRNPVELPADVEAS